MTKHSHQATPSQGPLVEVARKIGSTLGTVAATVKRARRLATGTPVRRIKPKTTVARKRDRKSIRRTGARVRRQVRRVTKRGQRKL
jgi:hypothetical protein